MKLNSLPLVVTLLGTAWLSGVASGRAAGTSNVQGTGAIVAIKDAVSWPDFLARHDLVWESIPAQWHEGAFIGNGALGAMIYGEGKDAASGLRWDIGRSDVTDRGHRLAIGQMLLAPQGKVIGGTGRLDLWNAEATGTVKTDRGEIQWRSFAHASDMLTVIELTTSPGEAECRWTWRPEPALDPRKVYKKEPIPAAELNPEPVAGKAGEVNFHMQPLKAGGEYTTAWREVQLAPHRRVLFLTVSYAQRKPGDPPGGPATQLHASEMVNRAAAQGLEALVATHRAWWHNYYPASFLSIPDTRLESFYWIQMYKLGSATRADRPAIDLMGPWFRTTPWAAIWWNLNLQLTYWPVYASNRLELGESLTRMLDRGVPNLIQNVPEPLRADSAAVGRVTSYDSRGGVGKEFGNLTWTLHNYWLQYRYSMDEAMLRERLFPLLRRSVNYYLHLLKEGDDGKLHLPVAISPEYPTEAADTNYDLSLLRWGCQTLIASCERLQVDDPLLPQWKETLLKLTPYPTDEKTGLMIGRDVPLAVSHRHFSHLLMIYPLYTMNWEQPENRALIEKSLQHWIGFQGALQGYSYTGAASISAQMGRGADAASLLNQFLDSYVKPNTMYLEAGPVIETPLAAATSVHDILLQSWGDKIRVFPAVPESWPDVTFHNLRAEGAFLVSAVRRGGQTQWVRVISLAGEPCRVKAALRGPLQASGERAFTVTQEEDGVVQIDLRKGETAILHPRDTQPDLTIAPVAAQPERLNFYGSRKVPPIVQAADGSFDLPAAQAMIHGEKLFYEKGDTKDNLGRWIDVEDWASWKLRVNHPGRFRVLLTYSAPRGVHGGTFAVSASGSSVTGKVQPTGAWETFQEFEAGTLSIPHAGTVEVSLRAVEKPTAALMNLRRVRLVPVEK